RITEPEGVLRELRPLGYPLKGRIEAPGKLEGGDVVWVDDDLCAVGLSYRTNLAGAEQFRRCCPETVECAFVHLPHYLGPNVILHLSSILSVLSKGLLLADLRYLSANFVQFLSHRNIRILPIPEDERITLGANVLSLGNDTLISLSGNSRTQAM